MPAAFERPPDSGTTQVIDPMIGRQVRDFRIEALIGRGGMGAVYRAEHLLLREPRALKVMRAELFHALPKAVERFEREARIAVKLRHPNLVLLYDFFVEDGDRFLVMEYVVGQSLAALLQEQGALSAEQATRIGIQCCAGLAYAHEMGIVHRDLSPENVMLTPSASGPQVKIIDFGVARAAFATSDQDDADGDSALTRVGQFLGKPRYASPEQAGSLRRGESLDQRSDLYTLGLILFEMLTASFPFHADTALRFLSLHALQPPATLSEVRPDLVFPKRLEQIVMRCLEKERGRRFATARELGEALASAAPRVGEPDPRDEDTEATEQFSEVVDLRPSPRAVVAGVTALAVLAALLGGGGFWWWSARETVSPRRIALPRAPQAAPVPPAPAPQVALPEEVPKPAPAEPIPAEAEPAKQQTLATAAPAPAPDPPPPAQAAPSLEKPQAAPRPSPAPQRKPSPAPVAVAAFTDTEEMQRAFDDALAFERTHDAPAAIASWKRFRSRGPASGLDERAKRRITDLTLGGLREYR